MIIPETGCFTDKIKTFRSDKIKHIGFNLLWVGKFDFRKQLEIALRTVAALKHRPDIKLIICGTGTNQQVSYYKNLSGDLGIDQQVEWKGSLTNQEVLIEMTNADLFFFTSVSEDTSTVVLEAVSCNLPVLCFDTCGMGYVINDKVGIKISLSNPRQSVTDFAEKIDYLYIHRDYLQSLSEGCKERQQKLSWENKALQVFSLYNRIIQK